MATIINNPDRPPVERTTVVQSEAGSGWVVAVVILIIVIVIGVLAWMHYYPATSQQNTAGTSVNVTVPSGSTGGNSAPATSNSGY